MMAGELPPHQGEEAGSRNCRIISSFVINGSKMAHSLNKKGIKAAGVWYQVEVFPNPGPQCRGEICFGWEHIEVKCGSKPKCRYFSGHHWRSDHKCNVVG